MRLQSFFLLWILVLGAILPHPVAADDTLDKDLIDAAKSGKLDEMERLIEAGADVDAKTGAPLIGAIKYNRADAIKLLLKKGANINGMSKTNYTPLMTAFGSYRYEIAKLLIEDGADVNWKTDHFYGETFALMNAVSFKDPKWIRLLIKAGADLNAQTASGQTVLISAAHRGYSQVVKALLDAGAGYAIKNEKGETALSVGVQMGRTDAVRLLIDSGADLNVKDKKARTPLMVAATEARTDTAEVLIKAGADIRVRDNNGSTILVRTSGSWKEQTGVVRLLLERGAEVNAKNKKGMGALRAAAAQGHLNVVKILVGASADLNARDNNGKTPLMTAVDEEETEVVRYLVDAGSDLSLKDKAGITALIIAERHRNQRLVKLLKEPLIEKAIGFLFRADLVTVPPPVATTSYPEDKWGDYSAPSAFDGKIGTAWAEGVKGSGIGEKIAFLIPNGSGSIKILPGFGSKTVFKVNSRVKSAELKIYSVEYKWQKNWRNSIKSIKLLNKVMLEFQDRMILQEFDLGIDPHPTNPYNHLLGVLEIQSIYKGQDPDTCIAEIQFSPKTYVWEDFMDGTWHASPVIAAGYSDRYIFKRDGTFTFLAHQFSLGQQIPSGAVLGFSGSWRRNGEMLVLTVRKKTVMEEEKGGLISNRKSLNPPEKMRLKLGPIIYEESFNMAGVEISGTPFWFYPYLLVD